MTTAMPWSMKQPMPDPGPGMNLDSREQPAPLREPGANSRKLQPHSQLLIREPERVQTGIAQQHFEVGTRSRIASKTAEISRARIETVDHQEREWVVSTADTGGISSFRRCRTKYC